MAAEFEQLISEYVERLPTEHADRRFLQALRDSVGAFVAHTPPRQDAVPITPDFVPGSPLAPGLDALAPDPGEPATPEPAVTDAGGTDQALPEQRERQERRSVRGRVAANPDYQSLPRGGRRGHFPLAEHPDGETTVYWEIYTFNKPDKPYTDRLEALGLQRGDHADVIGFVHRPTPPTTRDGKPRPALLYAAAPVKTR